MPTHSSLPYVNNALLLFLLIVSVKKNHIKVLIHLAQHQIFINFDQCFFS